GLIDVEDLVRGAVRDEDGRLAIAVVGGDEAGREGDDVGEEIAVDDAEGERVRGAVGEAGDGEVRRVYGIAREDILERAIDEGDVGAERAVADVPRDAARIGGEDDEAEF